MPHKHTRREKDLSTYDLPPTQVARSLPTTSQSKKNAPQKKPADGQEGKNLKRKRAAASQNDAPRAFKRLMAFQQGKKPRSGLDNGDEPRKGKGKKKGQSQTEEKTGADVETSKQTTEIPKIRPGERMSEFAARVDAALPISGLVTKTVKNGKDPLGLKAWRTRKEIKMHKLYDEWREQDRKLKEQREEDLEEEDEKKMEEEEMGVSWKFDQAGPKGKKKKKGKRTKFLGEAADDEEDPWEEIKRRRGEAKIGLHDVAQAPPELNLKRSKQKVVDGATVAVDGVPKAAGSLRRREELQGVREDVVASYRRLMDGKRSQMS